MPRTCQIPVQVERLCEDLGFRVCPGSQLPRNLQKSHVTTNGIPLESLYHYTMITPPPPKKKKKKKTILILQAPIVKPLPSPGSLRAARLGLEQREELHGVTSLKLGVFNSMNPKP